MRYDLVPDRDVPWQANQYSLAESAEMVGIAEELLIYWVHTKKVVPPIELPDLTPPGQRLSLFGYSRYTFTTKYINNVLRPMVEGMAAPAIVAEKKKVPAHKAGTPWTVKELAHAWNYGEDKIRALFVDEPGVIKDYKPPKKKNQRAYVILRIPEDVAARVLRRRTEL